MWRPGLLGWWIALLFMIGCALFALGSFPPYADATDVTVVGVTYFVGSIFFTAAGYLQLVQTINAPTEIEGLRRRRPLLLAWQPGRIDWWAAWGSIDREPAIQREHIPRHGHGVLGAAAGPADLGARPVRIDSVHDREHAGLARGVPPMVALGSA